MSEQDWADGFNRWLGASNGEWSLLNLTDAQKQSLLWIGISLIGSLSFWKGIPYGWKWLEVYCLDKAGGYIYEVVPKKNEHKRTVYDGHRKKVMIKRKKRQDVVLLKWFPILAPIKFLTVLYHEICHAIVGWMTGGRPILIIVDWNEGGSTFFRQTGGQPNALSTLLAGYTGSCIIGCTFLFLGFDTVAAKWAFLVFEVFAVISTLVCLKILPKSWVIHQRHWIQYKWAKITNNPTAAKRHAELAKAKTERERKNTVVLEDDHGTDETPATAEDKMVAIEVIGFSNITLATVVGLTWWWWDSIYLRFVILFIGTINAVYAIWDVYLDGVKFGKDSSSDATEIARLINTKRRQEEKPDHTVKYYATFWLVVQSTFFILVIVAALYTWRDTIWQQAERSRKSILATPNHYSPGDWIDKGKDFVQGVLDKEEDGGT